jgi:serine/threonine protein kinase
MPFMVMEFIDGATLKDAFKFKPVWQVEEACYLMLQLCDALSGLHRLGLAHRDLKPENVMVTRDWQVKLMDFGLVKDAQGLLKLFESEDILAGRDFAENIDKAMLAGTPEYMAPEQFSDPMMEDESQAKTDTWSDVYSLGLIFYQLLTGKKLFPFKAATGNEQGAYARALLAYIKQRTGFQDGAMVRPEQIPPKLWPIMTIALRQNPKQRYHNATELGDAIKKFAETGESESEFRDDEHTSMADMGMLLATLNARDAQQGAPAGAEAESDYDMTSVVSEMSDATVVAPNGMQGYRPRPARAGMLPGQEYTNPGRSKSVPPPALDLGAVQAYRQERLNRPGGPDYTVPPGQVHSAQVFPGGVPPIAFEGQQNVPPAVAPVPAMAKAPQKSGGKLTVFLLLALFVLAAGGAVGVLYLKHMIRFH